MLETTTQQLVFFASLLIIFIGSALNRQPQMKMTLSSALLSLLSLSLAVYVYGQFFSFTAWYEYIGYVAVIILMMMLGKGIKKVAA